MKDYLIRLSFIYRIRWLFLLSFTLVGNAFYLFAASPGHKNQAFVEQKKEEAVRLYERKRYAKANAQIALLLPLLKNRVDRAKFELYQAYCNFHEKKYLVSAHQFHLFVKRYASFPQVEEALFMRGYGLACQNVDIWLDQTDTYDAMRCLRRYLAVYPTGVYLHQASDALQNLQERLMQKCFQAALLYARLGYYNAAIVTLKNFEQPYSALFLKEEVLRLLIKCYEKLAMEASDKEKKQELISYSESFVQQLGRHLSDKKRNVEDRKKAILNG